MRKQTYSMIELAQPFQHQSHQYQILFQMHYFPNENVFRRLRPTQTSFKFKVQICGPFLAHSKQPKE
uniref:Uncharacterized protein n=1 Tax=Rhizophora mucronata TaxID=61149 RepID=A0A2P2NHX6_RHIMU